MKLSHRNIIDAKQCIQTTFKHSMFTGAFGLFLATILLTVGCSQVKQTHIDTAHKHDLVLPESPVFGEKSDKGALTILLTDFPIKDKNITSVMVNFRSIEVNSAADGWMTVVDFGDAGKTFDLLQLQNGVTSPLGSISLDPGIYDQMRFVLNDSNYVTVKTKTAVTQEPLKIPSGSQTGIKLIHSFTIDSQGYTVLTIDFDAQKSIHYNKGQGFILKPIISVIGAQTSAGASTMINAATGGSTGLLGQIMLDIPPGALNTDTNIEILPLKGTPFNPPLSSRTLLSNRYEILPDGTQFDSDITITMNYDPAELAAKGLDENTIDIVFYDVLKQDWISIGGTVNVATNTVTAQVNHFTAFGMTSAQGKAPMISPAEILYAGYDPVTLTTLTAVPEKVVATVAPKTGTIASVNLHLFKAGQAVNPSVIPMVENPVGSGQYEVILDPALFYPEVGANFDIQVYIDATDSGGGVSLAPKGALLADVLTWHLYTYNPDVDADGMNDRWEFDNGLDPVLNDAAGDLDGDGITNLAEYQAGTNPNGFNATVGGTATGLNVGEVITLRNNTETLNITGVGTGSDNFLFLNRVFLGGTYTVAIVTEPALKVCSISGESGVAGNSHISNVLIDCVDQPPTFVSLTGGIYHSAGIKSDGTLWTWGVNWQGQMGDGTTNSRLSPAQTGVDAWINLSGSMYHSMGGIKANGTLWTWGYNYYGQLGDGTKTTRYLPVQIGIDTNWINLLIGSEHTLALKSDGTLWGWGINWYGQVGDGTTTHVTVPVQVGIATDWAVIAIGRDHSMAIKTNGTLWAWGRNWFGQLGDGTGQTRIVPTQVGVENQWKTISCGWYHCAAIKTDGTIWAWGFNNWGQVGKGTTSYQDKQYFPLKIGIDTDWTDVSCGDHHCVALKTSGAIWGWGSNDIGQLGDGTTTNRLSPVQIGNNTTDWLVIAAGGYHTLALKVDGTLWSWGYNWQGQLGDGSTINRLSPVQIILP